jgi:hypothetical protein
VEGTAGHGRAREIQASLESGRMTEDMWVADRVPTINMIMQVRVPRITRPLLAGSNPPDIGGDAHYLVVIGPDQVCAQLINVRFESRDGNLQLRAVSRLHIGRRRPVVQKVRCRWGRKWRDLGELNPLKNFFAKERS